MVMAGEQAIAVKVLKPLSYATKSQQESNLQLIASEITVIYATGRI